jgi:hypothetical protein
MIAPDIRYEFVRCAKCDRAYQLIDFRGNPHQFMCPDNEPATADLDRLRIEYPNVRFEDRKVCRNTYTQARAGEPNRHERRRAQALRRS